MIVGKCPTCKAKGIDANLIAQKNPRTLKRFIRCENYDECQTGYPLPQYGQLEATDEVCEFCGAPMVIVHTSRGPWKLCPNFECPGKEKDEAKSEAGDGASKPKRTRQTKSRTKKTTSAKK